MKDGEGKIVKFPPWLKKSSYRQTLRFCLHHPSPSVLSGGGVPCNRVYITKPPSSPPKRPPWTANRICPIHHLGQPEASHPSPPLRSQNFKKSPTVPIFTNYSQESDTNLSESVSVSRQNGLPGRQTESAGSTTSASPRPATPALPSVRKISRSRPPSPFAPTIPKKLTLIYRNR